MKYTIDHISLSVLDNFWSLEPSIDIDSNLSIVRIDKIEDKHVKELLGEQVMKISTEINGKKPCSGGKLVLHQSPGIGFLINRPAQETNHCLCWKFQGEIKKTFHENYDRNIALKYFNYIVTALRLIKYGDVGRLPINDCISGDPAGQDGKFVFGNVGEDFFKLKRGIIDTYIFNVKEIDLLKRIFKALNKMPQTPIRWAISRFNDIYIRNPEPDKIIDAIIALETLYLYKTQYNLRYKLSSRVAVHLGNNDQRRRKDIYEIISEAYKIRSSIVHGDITKLEDAKFFTKNKDLTPSDFLNNLIELLRESLQTFLLKVEAVEFKNNFHKKLDDRIIKGEFSEH